VERLVVLVSERPAHRAVRAPVDDRLALAAAAFPQDDVRLDPYPRTVELLRAERFDDPVFVVGADQFRAFLAWSEPAEVLQLSRLAVATRPGFPRGELEAVLAQLDRPERVLFFEIEPNPAASTAVRARIAAGKPLDDLVPPAVARLITERGLYRP
jgi:nicotinate-nucleotide adenylyltransferase